MVHLWRSCWRSFLFDGTSRGILENMCNLVIDKLDEDLNKTVLKGYDYSR